MDRVLGYELSDVGSSPARYANFQLMKIIAKTKDYYDYLQGKYGVDPKLVYDRRNGSPMVDQNIYNRDGDTLLIAVAGILYPAIWIGGSWHYDRESFKAYSDIDRKNKTHYDWTLNNHKHLFDKNYLDFTDINRDLREPVLVKTLSYGWKNNFKEWVKPLTLQQFSFHKIKSAEEVYIAISSFLGWLVDNPPIPDKQTNREKIVSHGFDLKKSFRH